MKAFRKDILRLWLHQLRRRSQRSTWTKKRFDELLSPQLPAVEILQPYPKCASTPKSKVGTVCVSSASTGLYGGRRVTAVPTVTSRLSASYCAEAQCIEPETLALRWGSF